MQPGGRPVRIGLIGAGRIGSFHAENVARRLPELELVGVADPQLESARSVTERFGGRPVSDAQELIAADDIDAVVICATASAHADLVVAAAAAKKAVFCEKPMALKLADADRAMAAAVSTGVPLQVGFNRRFDPDFRAARQEIAEGAIGTPQLMRSLTRDPPLEDYAAVEPWTIFLETLIHDFDMLLWLNPGARPVLVFAQAGALVAPQLAAGGLLDTAVVMVRFDNGALATAEASYAAAYGYDVRVEVFGSGGMVTAGSQESSTVRRYTRSGMTQPTVRDYRTRFFDAYLAELAHFAVCVRSGATPSVTGIDARGALEIARAAIESFEAKKPVAVV